MDPTAARGTRCPGRLQVSCEQVGAYEKLVAHEQCLHAADDPDEAENSAANRVFEFLIPIEIAEPCQGRWKVPWRSTILPVWKPWLACPPPLWRSCTTPSDWRAPSSWGLLRPRSSLNTPAGGISAPVLDRVLADEAEAQEKSKRGGTGPTGQDDGRVPTSPEHEYRFYRAYHRPRHELLRQRCGHQAVTAHERLLAAGSSGLADVLKREHETERTTAHTIRPVPKCPLHPSELSVHEVPHC